MKTIKIESDGLPGGNNHTKIIDAETGNELRGAYGFDVKHNVRTGASGSVYFHLPMLSLEAGLEPVVAIDPEFTSYTFLADGKRYKLVQQQQ